MSCQPQRFAATLIFLMLLSACASKPTADHAPLSPKTNSTPAEDFVLKQQANTLSHWETSGAIAARNTKKGWTATFNWVQSGIDEYQIRLFGPLGGGTVLIDRHHGLTTYRDGSDLSSSADANTLLKQKTGVALPVANLYYWTRGLAAPGPLDTVTYDALHHIKSFHQGGYTIDYLSFISVHGIDLPKQIKLQGKGIMIKLIIKQWKF